MYCRRDEQKFTFQNKNTNKNNDTVESIFKYEHEVLTQIDAALANLCVVPTSDGLNVFFHARHANAFTILIQNEWKSEQDVVPQITVSV